MPSGEDGDSSREQPRDHDEKDALTEELEEFFLDYSSKHETRGENRDDKYDADKSEEDNHPSRSDNDTNRHQNKTLGDGMIQDDQATTHFNK